MKRIRPVPVDWPEYFWTRAESSYAGNDLECRGGCLGTGLVSLHRVCPRCRGSGLLVPRRTTARPGDLTPGEPAWTNVSNDVLVWPLPWVFELSVAFVRGARDLYHADDVVLAFMYSGRLILGLFRLDDDSQDRLGEAYQAAAGRNSVSLRFVLPKSN